MRGLPPVCRAVDISSLHLRRTESEVTGARGKVAISVLGVASARSLLLELLLELLTQTENKRKKYREEPY